MSGGQRSFDLCCVALVLFRSKAQEDSIEMNAYIKQFIDKVSSIINSELQYIFIKLLSTIHIISYVDSCDKYLFESLV